MTYADAVELMFIILCIWLCLLLSDKYGGFSLSESNDIEYFSIFLINTINEQFAT